MQNAVAATVEKLFNQSLEAELDRPDQKFGDYSTNVALKLAGTLGKKPAEIAAAIASELEKLEFVERAQVAGPGFINLSLSEQFLWQQAEASLPLPLKGQVAVAEYSDPNPFKTLHAGHLYTSVVGDAIANLLEAAGASVHRVNFGGDVGLHVAKTMWAIVKHAGDADTALAQINELSTKPVSERIQFITARYIEGNNTYEQDEDIRPQIVELNKQIYQFHAASDKNSGLARIYWTCRSWSYEYFDEFYSLIGSKFEKYYPESQTAPLGLATVQEHIGDVYEKSDGAIIFNGEKYGLHTRVFINSEGLPTYEAKDVGLIMAKWQDYKFDRSIIITGNDILEYMKVVLKSVEQFQPQLAQRSTHLTHGIVKLAGGVKMSSRLGNILGAYDVIAVAMAANKELTGNEDAQVTLGAIKYSFLKQRMGGDIIYDPAESVGLEGNSGPYLQYAHARACSLLAKAKKTAAKSDDLDDSERSFLRKIGEFSEVVAKSTIELMPHHICTYLYELAQNFNSFYEKSRIIDDPREEVRLELVKLYAQTLKNGLSLLGVEAPERM